MSTYYYFVDDNEYVELTSGSWYDYVDHLCNVVRSCAENNQPFDDFLKRLVKEDVFTGFWDCGTFLTPKNIKYFLQPLYNWAYKHKGFSLIDDTTLYDRAVRKFCKEKGLKYDGKYYFGYAPEIQKLLDKEDYLIDKYFKKVLSMYDDDKIYNEIGVDFVHAIVELKAGARIHRKAEPHIEWWMEDGKLCWTYGEEPEPEFFGEEVLADDWEYIYTPVEG